MKPARKGTKIQHNPYAQVRPAGTTRSTATKTDVTLPKYANNTSDNGKQAYKRQSANLNTMAVPKNRTPDTSPQMYNNTKTK
jgi:hypothetical protein